MRLIAGARLCLTLFALAFIAVVSVEANCSRVNPKVANGTLIDQLWRHNCDLVNAFLNNKFATAQADQTALGTQESFQYYAVQDYYYLLKTVQNKAFLWSTIPPSPESELAASIKATIISMQGSFEYACQFRQNLTSPAHLGVPQDIVANGVLQAAPLGYVQWLKRNTEFGWFAYQVSRIACIYGWGELAYRLHTSSGTNTTSMFYKEWILPNLDWGYGADLSAKLDAQIALYNNSETFKVYNQLFRQGMYFEIEFFDSAIGKALNDTAGGMS